MRKHRGPAPEDTLFFDRKRITLLRRAVCDLSWLLRHGYAPGAALALVGNHFQLTDRERLAIVHAASDGSPRTNPVTFDALRGKTLCIDGFNLLITLETALGGGIIIKGMDGCYRDIANIHGSYALRAETEQAIALAAEALKNADIKTALWLFDRPVSNSGRLAGLVNEHALKLDMAMHAETANNVDTRIKQCDGVAVTGDSDILSSGVIWFDLAGWLIGNRLRGAAVVDLGCRES